MSSPAPHGIHPSLRAPSFVDALGSHRNAIGFLRWLFAAFVIFGHTPPITGADPFIDVVGWWSDTRSSIGGLAVGGFFVLSGFLVQQSRSRSRSTGNFLWRRFLRIMPGYWACLIVTAGVFAPLAWLHEQGGLFGVFRQGTDSPLGYVGHNFALVVHQNNIGGLLDSTPLAGTPLGPEWNGSLWTLKYEVLCYVALAIVFLVARRRTQWVLGGACAISYLLVVLTRVDAAALDWSLGPFYGAWIVQFGFLFSAGAFVAAFGDRIRVDDRLGIAAAIVVAASMPTPVWPIVGYPAVVYVVLWAAARIPVRNWERFGDISYGTYVYAFPIQMLMADYGLQRLGTPAFVALSIVLASAAGLVSWHLVEKHALRLKSVRFTGWRAPARTLVRR